MQKTYSETFRIASYQTDLTARIRPSAIQEIMQEMAAEALRLPVYTDLDVNGHVNNTRYLDWCCNALGIETMRGYAMQHFAVNFNQEILAGQEVRTVLHTAGDAFSFSGFEGEKRHFDVGGTLVKQ